MADLNFGYQGGIPAPPPAAPQEPKTELDPKEPKLDENGNPIVDVNDVDKDKNANNKPNPNDNDNNNKPSDTNEGLTSGTKIEVDGKTYTVDDNGNVVDETGAIFKEAKDVADWMKDFETTEEDDDKTLTISNIAKALDLEIVDEEGKPIQYEDTPEGIKAYVKDAIDTAKDEVAEETINTLYANFPFIKPMIDYYIANGNSIEGFNEIPDRSNIEVDDSNEAQQISIIRTAWTEFGRRGNVDQYIDYLKNSGTLKEVAKEELQALKESDAKTKSYLEAQAKAAQEKQLKESQAYWGKVESIVKSKKLAGYELPDSISVERDGKKLTATLNDFYNYISKTDKDGLTAYARDLMKDTAEARMEDDILRAYLKFTGGNYSNLVDLAINEQKVKTLKLRANQQRKQGTIRITPPKQNNHNDNNNYGY